MDDLENCRSHALNPEKRTKKRCSKLKISGSDYPADLGKINIVECRVRVYRTVSAEMPPIRRYFLYRIVAPEKDSHKWKKVCPQYTDGE